MRTREHRTHCPHGHEYTDKNTYFNKKSKAKVCKTCLRQRASVFLKEYSKKYPEKMLKAVVKWNKKNKKKLSAHLAMKNALYRGELLRETCQVCGNEKTDGHHENYNKPLEVIWLCRKHHKQLHSGELDKSLLIT